MTLVLRLIRFLRRRPGGGHTGRGCRSAFRVSALAALTVLGGLHPGLALAQDPLESSFEDLTEAIPSDDDDVVETIGPPEPVTAVEESPPDAAASPLAESATSFRSSGYVRQSLELSYGELSRQSHSLGRPTLWRDSFVSRTQLVLRASYLEGRSFEATVSGMLGYALHAAEQAPQYSIGRVDLSRGEVDADLREAYLGFFWPAVDLRIGQQRIAWGRSDFQSPNDVINARDLRDPFLAETELTHLPTLAVRSSVSSGPVTFEIVASPIFVPDRYDVYGSSWSVVQRRAPDEYERFLGTTSLLADQSVERDLAAIWRQTERPRDNGKGASAGARLAASLGGMDVSAYYHYGYDGTPVVSIHPDFQAYLRDPDTDLTSGAAPELAPVLDLIAEGKQPITSRYVRRHHVGLDAATALGPVIVRVDGAYETRRVFYQADLNGFTTPTALGVLGLEYQTGSLDDVALIELLGQRLLDVLPSPLLGYRRTTLGLAGALRWSLGASLGIDVRGLVGLRRQFYAIRPALRYKPNDSFSVYLGVLIVAGEPYSLGWYYADNDSAFVQLRYAF